MNKINLNETIDFKYNSAFIKALDGDPTRFLKLYNTPWSKYYDEWQITTTQSIEY